jgi:Ca2+/Na+ antiporter
MPLSAIKSALLFWGIGAIIAAAIFGLASALPSIFGTFTLPFWILPGLAGFGAHDNVLPLGLLGASVFYGIVSSLLIRFVIRRRTTRHSK